MTLPLRSIGLVSLLVLVPALFAADPSLLTAARIDDMAKIKRLLRAGADANARDASGATVLMYAAAFGSLESLRSLLDSRADVNAVSTDGSTALMWSTGDTGKVRLLLARGAQVNARSKQGGTALLSAALRHNVEALRLLITAGADLKAEMSAIPETPLKLGLLSIAYTTTSPDLRDFLSRTALQPRDAGSLGIMSGVPLLPSLFSTFGFSLQPQPVPSLASVVSAILRLGANPNDNVRHLTLVSSPLACAALHGDLDTMRVLLDHGADVNQKASRKLTALMMAAASERTDSAGLRLLLEHGAEIDARDDQGRTALDWALLKGDTEASVFLREKGARAMAPAAAAPAPFATPRSAREAVTLAIGRLQPAGPGFHQKAGCISCHNQSLPSIAVAAVSARGVAIDREIAKHPAQATLAMWGPSREHFLLGDCAIFGFLGNITYGLLGLAEEGLPPNSTTDAAASCLSSLQMPDGRWEGSDDRPPLSGISPIRYTAMAIRGLKTYAPGNQEHVSAQIARARSFLQKAVPADTQEQAFKVLGLVWSGASRSEISEQVRRLISLQRQDGGWAQLSTMQADAYATGQALYALRASGVAVASPAYRAGVNYLLGTQLEDGTWYVHSRAVPFQPFFESGFPHGTDQFISAAATSWAAIALAYTL
jgi:ankyrin repeat protein